MTTNNIKYDFEPAQPTPGDDYDRFNERLLNAATVHSDDRGWSLADHMLGIDEGGPSGPAFPVQPAANAKAQTKFRSRQKESYGMITKHVLDADHITEMRNSHFQQGYDAYEYLRQSCQRTVGPLRIRELNK